MHAASGMDKAYKQYLVHPSSFTQSTRPRPTNDSLLMSSNHILLTTLPIAKSIYQGPSSNFHLPTSHHPRRSTHKHPPPTSYLRGRGSTQTTSQIIMVECIFSSGNHRIIYPILKYHHIHIRLQSRLKLNRFGAGVLGYYAR